MSTTAQKRLLKDDELTAELRDAGVAVAVSTVKRWSREKRIPTVKVTPRTFRFERDAVFQALGISEPVAAGSR